MTDILPQNLARIAVADIGANSVRMNIYNVDTRDGSFCVVTGARSMLGLAAYVKDGALDRDGEGKLFSVVRDFLAKANGYLCDDFLMFATASLRGLSNGESIINKINEKFGIKVEIISGQREAQLDYRATRYRFDKEMNEGAVVDMGGGSTEIIKYNSDNVLCSESVPIGCLMLVREFIGTKGNTFPDEEQRRAIKEYVNKCLSGYPSLKDSGEELYLIGGTARAAFSLVYAINGKKTAPGEGAVLSVAQVEDAFEKLKNGSVLIQKTVPDRVRTIIPGMTAYIEIFRFLGGKKLILSLSGVREGYFYDYLTDKKYLKFREF